MYASLVAQAFFGIAAMAISAGDRIDARAELLAADRAFAKAAAERGLDGWMSFMTDDVARVTKIGEKIISGKEAVRKADARVFADPKRKLVWDPVDAHVFADGKTGLTSGRYRMLGTENGKETVLSSGGYVTGWRKDANGQWKVNFDTGTPDSAQQPKK